MKTNSNPLVTTTLMVLAGTALAAPLPQNWSQLTPAEIATFPPGLTYDPTHTYDPTTKTPSDVATVNNNRGGDGNNSGNKAPLDSTKKPEENAKPVGGKPAKRRDANNDIMGNFHGNVGNLEVESDVGNDAGNTNESSSQDSHNTSVQTSLGLFRRDTNNDIMGNFHGNVGSLKIESDIGNDADNTSQNFKQDSHNVAVSTGLDLPIPF